MTWKRTLTGIVIVVISAIAAATTLKFQKAAGTGLPGVVEIQEVRLGSKVGGRVSDIRVTEGDIVDAGQLLVRFETPELEAEAVQQEGRLAAAEAELEKAKNGPRDEEIRQARSDLQTAEADLTLAGQDVERAEHLYPKSAISKAEFDAAHAAHNRALGRVASNHARLDLLLAGTRKEDVAIAEAKVVEARGKFQEIKANLAESQVLAPERSVIQVVTVRKGDLVPAHQPVIRVLRADDLWVKVYVPETDLGSVRLLQQVDVTTDTYPDRRLRGNVFQISSESEFTPRNVQTVQERRYQVFGVKVRVDDPEGILKPGMAVNVLVVP